MACQGIPVQTRHKSFSREEWEQLKPVIEDLYMTQNKSFKQIAEFLTESYEFTPTLNQFKKILTRWNLKKNITKNERQGIIDSLEPGQSAVVHGRLIDGAKRRRWAKEERRANHPSHSPSSALNSATRNDTIEATSLTVRDSEATALAKFAIHGQDCKPNSSKETTKLSIPHERNSYVTVNIVDSLDGPNSLAILIGYLTVASVCDDVPDISKEGPLSRPEDVANDLENYSQMFYDLNILEDETEDEEGLMDAVEIDLLEVGFFHDTNHGGGQLQASTSTNWEMTNFPFVPTVFPHVSIIVPEVALFDCAIPMQQVQPMLSQCSKKLRNIQVMNPTEVTALEEDMFKIADTYFSSDSIEHLQQAEKWYRRIVTAKQNVLWCNPIGTLKACAGVIDTIQRQGRYLEACGILETFLPGVQRVLPAHHYLAIKFKQVWATCLKTLPQPKGTKGSNETVENAQLEIIQTCLGGLGMRHETTLWVLLDLGCYAAGRGSLSESEVILTTALDIIRTAKALEYQKWTTEARLTWNLMMQLTRVLCDQGKFSEAGKALQSARSSFENLIKSGDKQWMKISYQDAWINFKRGQMPKSKQILLGIFQQSTWKNEATLVTRENLICLMALVVRDGGNFEEATPWLEERLAICLNRHGHQSEDALEACNDLGSCYAQRQMYNEAISLFSRTIGVIESGAGQGLLSARDCSERLREYMQNIIVMQRRDRSNSLEDDYLVDEADQLDEERWEVVL